MTRNDLETWTDEQVKELADKGEFIGAFEYGIRMYNQDRYQESWDYLYPLVNHNNFFIWNHIIDMADYYLKGIISDKELFELLVRRHNYGSSSYSYKLAHMYRDGRGCRRSLTKYIELLKICSNDGSTYATYELAECYENGFGVRKSMKKAFEVYYYWLDDHGRPDPWCEYKVAYYMLHELGGAKKDMTSIEYYLKRAAWVHSVAENLYIELFGEQPPTIRNPHPKKEGA